MKKGLFLLTSLLVTGTAGASVAVQNNTQLNNNIQENVKSFDTVDLTMPWWGYTKSETANLTNLLNDSAGRFLNTSSMKITEPNGMAINATSSFDNSSLRGILLLDRVHIDKTELSVSSEYPYSNYVMAYYTYWESSENTEKSGSKVINRFDWSGIDMTPFWTENIKFEFELSF